MSFDLPRGLAVLLFLSMGLVSCRPTPSHSSPVVEPPPPPPPGPCEAIEAATYRPLPRKAAGNQLDPSGIVLVGGFAWVINDREGRKGVPPEGNGVFRLDLTTGALEHVAVPGFDDVSRKFEGLAWDGRELHAIGNVGNREANTFLVSFALDPETGMPAGEARYHDLATALGTVTGLGDEPWGHGIKVEALAALEPGVLLVGLRRMGDGKARRAYRVRVSAPGTGVEPLQLEPVTAFDRADLGTAVGGDGDTWRMERELAGLSEPTEGGTVIAVASAEYEEGDTWEFLSNALLVWPVDSGSVQRLCTFDAGLKVEGVAAAPQPDSPGRYSLVLLYDNDSAAPGGYKVVEGVSLGSPPP
jgi:hypothetical protein